MALDGVHPSSPTGKRPRVLLIDDNLTQLDLYALALEKDADVVTATRGESGYVVACAERMDAIIVDVLLPDVDGLEICHRLLRNPLTASTPLIVLTGDDAALSRAMSMRSLDGVLKKPCSADVLLDVVRKAVAVRRIQ